MYNLLAPDERVSCTGSRMFYMRLGFSCFLLLLLRINTCTMCMQRPKAPFWHWAYHPCFVAVVLFVMPRLVPGGPQNTR